jgi:hypothetical protein
VFCWSRRIDAYKVEWVDEVGGEAIIHVRWEYRPAINPFTKRHSKGSYRGSGTVWRSYPSGLRVDTEAEMDLCDLWTVSKWDDEKKGEKNEAKTANSVS